MTTILALFLCHTMQLDGTILAIDPADGRKKIDIRGGFTAPQIGILMDIMIFISLIPIILFVPHATGY